MAIYTDLEVYKSSYNLTMEIHKMLINLNKAHKYTIGDNIRNESLNILTSIYRSSSNKENRKYFITQSLESIELVRLQVRILKDLGALKIGMFCLLNKKIEDVKTQFEKWNNSLK